MLTIFINKKNKFHTFEKKNYAISNRSICPFNSQNTVWQTMLSFYLPFTACVTDIWRGFIALRILKNYNLHLSFLN